MFCCFVLCCIQQNLCVPFPNCHKVLTENVWRQKNFACSVYPPAHRDDTPNRYKVSFYIESNRRFFKDRFQYKVVPGYGIQKFNAPKDFVSKPPYFVEWLECAKVPMQVSHTHPELQMDIAYCPFSIVIKNRNWFSTAKLGMMFHVDDNDTVYTLPPPELRKPKEVSPLKPRKPSPSAEAFKILTTIFTTVFIVVSIMFVIGYVAYRLVSKMFVNKEKKKKIPMTEKERLAALLRKGERIRIKKKELGLSSDEELTKKQLQELSSSDEGDYDESGDDSSPDDDEDSSNNDREPLLRKRRQHDTMYRRSTPQGPARMQSEFSFDEAERRFDAAIERNKRKEEERQRLLWGPKSHRY